LSGLRTCSAAITPLPAVNSSGLMIKPLPATGAGASVTASVVASVVASTVVASVVASTVVASVVASAPPSLVTEKLLIVIVLASFLLNLTPQIFATSQSVNDVFVPLKSSSPALVAVSTVNLAVF